MTSTTDATSTPTMVQQITESQIEPTPPPSSESHNPVPTIAPAQSPTPAAPNVSTEPTPPASKSGVDSEASEPTTPASEPELDFTGNVNVNNNIPTQQDLDKCADLLVLDAQGESRPFKDLYAGAGVAPRQLIIFVRHFFCGNCQEYLRTLSSSITPEALLTLPTPTFITVIGCGRPELIEMYAQTTACPFPIYADPTTKLYDILGMNRTLDLGKKKPEYIQSNFFATTVQSIVQGIRTGRNALSGGDFKQVGGEFMFENGKIVWCHRMRNTRDHAEVTALRKVLGLDDTKPPIRKRWSHSIKEIKKGRRSGSWGRHGKEEKRNGEKKVKEETKPATNFPATS